MRARVSCRYFHKLLPTSVTDKLRGSGGSTLIKSSSHLCPHVSKLDGARSQITTTPSNRPLLHASMNCDRFISSGRIWMSSATSASDPQ